MIVAAESSSPASKVPIGTKFASVNSETCLGKSKSEVIEMINQAKAAGPTFTIEFVTDEASI